jgi:hypothetical protein
MPFDPGSVKGVMTGPWLGQDKNPLLAAEAEDSAGRGD